MVDGNSGIPAVAFVGGSEIGLGFFQILLRLHESGDCLLVGALPAHKDEVHAPLIAPAAEASNVFVLKSLDEVLSIEQVDIVISAGNHLLFSDAHIAHVSRGIVNFHAAPLPDYRGSACPAFAILNKEAEFGFSFHLVAPELDAGPILYVEHFEIEKEWTSGELDQKCVALGIEAFARLAPDILGGRMKVTNEGKSTSDPYKRSDIEPHRQIDMSWSADRIWQHVRACDWDGVLKPAFANIGDRRIYLSARPRGSWF